MLTDDDIRQIEAWLDGELDEADLAAFEIRLRDDPGFAAEVVLRQKMRQAVGEKDVGAFRQTVGNLLRERRAAPQHKTAILRYTWVIAAALLLALAAIWFVNQNNNHPAIQEAYASAFQPPERFEENAVRLRENRAADSVARRQQNRWAALNAAWAKHQYDQAKAIALAIAQSPTASEDDIQGAFFAAGVIALTQDSPAQALQYLERAQGKKVLAEEIRWYAALARVKLALQDPAQKESAVMGLKYLKKGTQPADRYPLIDQLLNALEAKD